MVICAAYQTVCAWTQSTQGATAKIKAQAAKHSVSEGHGPLFTLLVTTQRPRHRKV